MTVLDAFAVVALMREEPAAEMVAGIVRSPTVRLRTRYCDRSDAAVSLADRVAAATALHLGRPIATADPALAAVVRTEGGTVTALPDSRGRTP